MEKLKKDYQNRGFVFIRNFLPAKIHKRLLELVQPYSDNLVFDNLRQSPGRTTVAIPYENEIYEIIYGKSSQLMDLVRYITSGLEPIQGEFPIEYREYYQGSEGMEWHTDTELYCNPCQIEAVITLDNTSDSRLEWEWDGKKGYITPKPNSVMVIQTEKPLHRVTPLTVGDRQILKIVIPFKKSQKTPAYYKELENLMKLMIH